MDYRFVCISNKYKLQFIKILLLNTFKKIIDAIIKYSFDDIMQIKISNEAILFLNPSLVSWLKIGCEEDCDFENVAESIKLSTRKWLIITINNNNSVHIKGSHWSLLLCNIEHGFLFHFDSSNDNNHDAAFETGKYII